MTSFNRRTFLSRGAALGCSAAASPFLTPVSFAAAPWDTRLVVIILRGAMDGLDVVRPYGSPEYAAWRGALGGGPESGALDLDGFYALHPALERLIPMWRRGELGFVHAVSTPYRDRRSHFDGQDLLEAGTVSIGATRDGWLNRMLGLMPGVEGRTAFAIGHGDMKILNGPVPVSDWSPDSDLTLSPQATRLAELIMQDDPAFHAVFSEALELSADGDSQMAGAAQQGDMGDMGGMGGMTMPAPARGEAHVNVAKFAAEQLRGDSRIAAFSLNGWDTHVRQEQALGRALRRLSQTILGLERSLGTSIWGKTAVVAMTEFGRTARVNGTAGTDHGTGGAMLLAGGAVRGGRVYGNWPGLAEADLYDRRDLMPTADVRAHAAWMMRGLVGLDVSALENTVFPGLDMGRDLGLLR